MKKWEGVPQKVIRDGNNQVENVKVRKSMMFNKEERVMAIQEWEYKPSKGKEIDLGFNQLNLKGIVHIE